MIIYQAKEGSHLFSPLTFDIVHKVENGRMLITYMDRDQQVFTDTFSMSGMYDYNKIYVGEENEDISV